jgi:S-adenosylmethionine hydrolase
MGVLFESVGPTVSIPDLIRLTHPTATVRDGRLETQIVSVMIYGNVTFAGTMLDLTNAVGPLVAGRPLRLTFGPIGGGAEAAVDGANGGPATGTAGGGSVVEDTVWGITFGSVPLGSSVLMSDSEGQLSFADNQGNAAARLGLAVDRPVTITGR